MNCIDVHRKLTTHPATLDEDVAQHIAQCATCAKYAQSMHDFDQSLQQAANIDVPDGLAERILLKQNFKHQHQQRHQRFRLYAIAASLFIAIGIGLNVNTFQSMLDDSLSLEEVALRHVTSELDHLNDKKNVQLAKLNTVLQPFNIQLKKQIGQVNYAGTCPIRNSRGVHIVLEDQGKTATLLLMPGEYVNNRKMLTKDGFTTTVIPTQNGSIAIVTDKDSNGELLRSIETNLDQSIQYI